MPALTPPSEPRLQDAADIQLEGQSHGAKRGALSVLFDFQGRAMRLQRIATNVAPAAETTGMVVD